MSRDSDKEVQETRQRGQCDTCSRFCWVRTTRLDGQVVQQLCRACAKLADAASK